MYVWIEASGPRCIYRMCVCMYGVYVCICVCVGVHAYCCMYCMYVGRPYVCRPCGCMDI